MPAILLYQKKQFTIKWYISSAIFFVVAKPDFSLIWNFMDLYRSTLDVHL